MDANTPFGLTLFQKQRKDSQVLKDLLQLLKTQARGKAAPFAYVEAENSLLPHLTLWENLQLVTGQGSWREYQQSVRPEYRPLVNLITRPEALAREAEHWEKFTVSLLKGLMSTGHLLVDMNEDLLSPLIIQNFKKTLISVAHERQIYLASAVSGLWLDCAHSLVCRQDYVFVTSPLNAALVKRHWAA